MRNLSRAVAESYYAQREKLGFPGVKDAGARKALGLDVTRQEVA